MTIGPLGAASVWAWRAGLQRWRLTWGWQVGKLLEAYDRSRNK
jgi:hypothetical protein